ncbi:MAG: gloB 1 [Proteobacteria bacterium]|jgi:glyoxylase-like metal-dependent hydrolase (beta-lactamase superfamily II)|nr:gloB 1 [Pseudomonadota bacterium]
MPEMADATRTTWQRGPVTVYFGEKSGKYPDGNQVLVRGSDTLVAFDTPQVANHIGPALDAADLVILGHVHEDHMAGLHRLPKALVQVHEADLDAARSWPGLSRHYGYPPQVLDDLRRKIEVDFHYRPRPDATGYADGQVWELGGVRVRAVHLPGHTAGHCVLRVEPQGIAFIGDFDLSSFGPYYGDATSSLTDFRRSLQRLADLPASVWITSHHKGVIDDQAQFDALLQAFAGRIDEREARLLQMLAAGPQSLEQLVGQRLLYPPEASDLWVGCAEARSISQHLDELIADGRVLRTDDSRFALAAR